MLLRARKNARHAKPSKAAPTMVAAGMTASFVAMDVAAMATSASASVSESDLAKLRACESGGNYAANTGNGYYGAYQFALSTWRGLGYAGRPDQASPATQDAAVRKLQARSGWGQWPACSRRYNLGSGDSSASAPVTREVARADRSRRATPAHRTVTRRVHVAVAPEVPPPFIGKPLTVADAGDFRIGVHDWQARMQQRGWPITVDGFFGPQSAHIARRFAAEKNLQHAGLSGEVDQVVWDAAWRLPVS
ncbi:MAG: transglycosylase family protein [Mycobacteriales bacterium]